MKENTQDGFAGIKPLITARFEEMKTQTIFNVDYDRDTIVETYLGAFDTPEMRQEHNCTACKQFLRAVGGMVVINDGKVESLWDTLDMDRVPNILRASVKALAAYVKTRPINDLFFSDMPSSGVDKNIDPETKVVWQHFYLKIPREYVNDKNNTLGKKSAETRETKNVLKRGLEELKIEDLDTVRELIAQGSIYRGSEHDANLAKFRELMLEYLTIPASKREGYCWKHAVASPTGICRLRNTVIGSLLVDLFEGKPLEAAVRSFEVKVAPANYQRPTALVTPRMVEAAKAKLVELNLVEALSRRRLDTRDLTAANALFVYRPTKATKDVFDMAMADQPVDVKSFTKVEKVGINDFLEKVLPTVKSMKLLVQHEHLGNFVTLTGPADPDAKSLMKWGNSFGWSYTGGVADSLKEKVKLAGGKTDGWMGIRLGWHNYDDLDLHFCKGHTPGGNYDFNTDHVFFRNKRNTHAWLDVDMNAGSGQTREPVENITMDRQLPPGPYCAWVNMFSKREDRDTGYDLEIEVNGEKYTFGAVKSPRENSEIIKFTVNKDGTVAFQDCKSSKSSSTTNKWGVKTNMFRKVNAITLSPNHWERPVGNKHVFFLLEGCVSDEQTRPFYNEFLTPELAKDRKTMEILGSKITVAPADGVELSGLGFSDTLRNRIFAEVEGVCKRTVEIVF